MYNKFKTYFNGSKTIQGANISNINNAEFNMLSDAKHKLEYSENEIEMLKTLEGFIQELYEVAENQAKKPNAISELEIQEGKVVLNDGVFQHRCSANMQTLEGISTCGILATEWFGLPEAEGEGRLCVFGSKYIDPSNLSERAAKFHKKLSPVNCLLFFDTQNELMKKLIDLDFFEYQKIRKTNPEKISELYPDFIIELYEKIILPLSPSSKTFHDEGSMRTENWVAVPGAIPPSFVNGIQISTQNLSMMENIEKIQKLYPHATIFDENNNVLALPLASSNESAPNAME